MKMPIPFTLGDGKTQVYFEVIVPPDKSGIEPAGRIEAITHRAAIALDSVLLKIRGTAETIVNNLKEMASSPNEIEVSFGVKLTMEADAIVVSGTSEANLSITLKWKNRD